jgi:hypothetical protein
MYHQRFKSLEERLAEKYHVAPNGCWLWNTGKDEGFNYPKFWIGSGYVKASHLMWERANGRKLESGELVLHRCDTPRCVNPDHLFVGGYIDNMQDRRKKGRGNHPRGERNGRARITRAGAEKIRKLRTEGISQQAIADRLGISQATVSRVLRGVAWD